MTHQARIRGLPLLALLDAFDATEQRTDEEMPMVRGWLMNELEIRNPSAFVRWLDSDATSPREFYLSGGETLEEICTPPTP